MNCLNENKNETENDQESAVKHQATQCEICLKMQSKYKCPRCSLKTCSLDCCRKHKEDSGCSGQRDKTKFISKEQFNESSLMNDYRFLEEQSRVIDAYQRASELGEEHILNGKTLSSNTSLENDAYKTSISYGVYENLRKFVHKQFNICLKLMPPQSSRHLNNKTRFNRSANLVSWSIEFVFHLDSDDLKDRTNKYFRFDTKRVLFCSKESLKSTLLNFYKKFKADLFDKGQNKYLKEDEIKLKKLNCLYEQFGGLLESEDFRDLNVLYEVQDLRLKKKFYLNFDLEKSLEECLNGRSMIEYPSLFLVRTKSLQEYEIVNRVEKEVDEPNDEKESPDLEENDDGDKDEGELDDESDKSENEDEEETEQSLRKKSN